MTPPPAARPHTDAERREHSRRHSHIHARNLSTFFPHPGSAAERELDAARAAEKHARAPSLVLDTSPLKDDEARLSTRSTRRAGYLQTSAGASEWEKRMPSRMRHVSPLSPDLVSRSLPRAPSAARSPSHSATGEAAPRAAPALAIGGAHMALGFAIWVCGQMRDSLALLGLGFLVVFDALGVLSQVSAHALEAMWLHSVDSARVSDATPGALRRPYGVRRAGTLMYFAELVYIIFAGMYMCKENVEHALLAANLPHAEDREGLALPRVLLAITTAACLLTSTALRNHGALAAACGIGARSGHARAASALDGPSMGALSDALLNPFSALVILASSTLFLASLLPPAPVAALDKVLAGVQGAAMLYVASFAIGALSRVLLQAAPDAPHLAQLHRALALVEEHPAVRRVADVHVWQLSPPSLAYSATPAGGLLDSGTQRRGARSAALIATVHLELQENASPAACLDATKVAWMHCAPAVGADAGALAGEPLRGTLVAGELTVEVVRRGRIARHSCWHEHGCGHCHEHAHDHAHEHAHEHAHDHAHDHGHEHAHDHAHDHAHGHAHDHAHDHAHAHAHDHAHAHTTPARPPLSPRLPRTSPLTPAHGRSFSVLGFDTQLDSRHVSPYLTPHTTPSMLELGVPELSPPPGSPVKRTQPRHARTMSRAFSQPAPPANVPDEVLMPPPPPPPPLPRHNRTLSLGALAHGTPRKMHVPTGHSPRIATRPLYTPPQARVPPSHLPKSMPRIGRYASDSPVQQRRSDAFL